MTFLRADGGAEVLTGSGGSQASGGITISGTADTLAGATLGPHDRLDIAALAGVTPLLVFTPKLGGGRLTVTDGTHAGSVAVAAPVSGQLLTAPIGTAACWPGSPDADQSETLQCNIANVYKQHPAASYCHQLASSGHQIGAKRGLE